MKAVAMKAGAVVGDPLADVNVVLNATRKFVKKRCRFASHPFDA
jgi:hypothetical protein